jgi:hypothetical protein
VSRFPSDGLLEIKGLDMNRRIARTLATVTALGAVFAAGGLRADEPVPDIAGIYELDGETTVEGSVDQFHITGKLLIRQDGPNCTTSVEGLFQRVEGDAGPASFAMIGTGTAELTGRKFYGVSTTQTMISEVPGMDVNAPFMPRKFGPKLETIADGEVLADGTIVVELRSTQSGEGFVLPEGRKTILRAKRVARSATELKTPKK